MLNYIFVFTAGTCHLKTTSETMVPASGFCPVTFDLLPTLLQGPLPPGLIG